MRLLSATELRPFLVGGGAPVAALARNCEAEVLAAEDWAERPLAPAPDFLLVEAGEATEPFSDAELDRLLERCRQAGVRRLLWIAGSPIEPRWLEHIAKFDRVFTMDRDQLQELEAARAKMPVALWPATDVAIAPRDKPATEGIVWLGGWRRDWPA